VNPRVDIDRWNKRLCKRIKAHRARHRDKAGHGARRVDLCGS
jgi:hypothetical protein